MRWTAHLKPACWMALALSTACVDQEKEIARYRAVLDDDRQEMPLPPADAAISLQEAMRSANQHNERLPIEGENYLQAMIEKDRAFAGFLPRITLSPSYSIIDTPGTPSSGNLVTNSIRNAVRGSVNSLVASTTRNTLLTALGASTTGESTLSGGGGSSSSSGGTTTVGTAGGTTGLGNTNFHVVGSTLRNTQVPVTGSINLFNGFRDAASVKRSSAVISQRVALLLNLQEVVLLEVSVTYYEVLRSERLVQVLRNSLNVQEERVRDIRARQSAGLARPLDVAQTEAQEAATKVSLIQAESNVRKGRTTLAFLIGNTAVAGRLSDDFDVPLPLPPVSRYENDATQHRHDLVAAEAAVRAARANVDIAIGQYYPSVSFNVTAFLYQENFRDASRWNALFTANLPIFSAGLIEADVREAWSLLRQVLLSESLLKRQVRREVKIAHENLQTSQRRLQELQVQVRAAGEAFHQADQTYTVGLATNLERLTAQDQLLTAQVQLASEEYNYKVFYLDLLRVTGLLREEVLDVPTTMPASTEPSI